MADTQNRSRRVKLVDVALKAGVSSVTVSRTLRRPDMVSLELRQRVERAVNELAYIPSRAASALASSRTHTIGVVISSLTNGVFADYLRALHDVFLPAGFQVLVLNSRYSPAEEERAIATLLGQHPEAMILAATDQTAHARRLLERAGVPVVQTMELSDDPIDINIGLSQCEAGYAATRYLARLGHRRIGAIAARLDSRTRSRIEGYRRAMAEAGLDTEGLVALTHRRSSVAIGAESLREVLKTAPDLEAVFCGNDDLALGVLFECGRLGIPVPGQMSIVGFNDLEYAASAFPSLTSVATPRYEMGRKSAEIVLEIIRGSGKRPVSRRIDLSFSISERQSTSRRSEADTHGAALPQVSAV